MAGSSVAESDDYLNKHEATLAFQEAFEKLHKIDTIENDQNNAMNSTGSHERSKITEDKDLISQDVSVKCGNEDSIQ